MTHSQRQFFVPILLAGLVCAVVLAVSDTSAPAAVVANGSDEQPDVTAGEELFVRRVFPIFHSRCLGCHGLQQGPPEGGLDLRSELALKGGESGHPLVVSEDPAQSPLLKAVSRDSADWSAMPPKEAEKLTQTELGWISQWILEGTPWPDQPRMAHILKVKSDAWSDEDGVTVPTSGGLNDAWNERRYPKEALWAWQPLNVGHLKVTAPHTIDALIEQKIPEGLAVAPSAEAEILLRRASLDLLGLPPSVHDVQEFQRAFIADPESAVPRLIDRLLTSPHYGERMAQH